MSSKLSDLDFERKMLIISVWYLPLAAWYDTPKLTSLPKDAEVSCELRLDLPKSSDKKEDLGKSNLSPARSPTRSLISLNRA